MSPITPLDIESHSIAMMHQWIDIWSPQDFRANDLKVFINDLQLCRILCLHLCCLCNICSHCPHYQMAYGNTFIWIP